MKNHPYSSTFFRNKWNSHFALPSDIINFESIPKQSFIKKKYTNLHYNTGSNFTLQNWYFVNSSLTKDLRKKVLLIYNVPSYFEVKPNNIHPNIKVKPIREYIGYLIDTKGIDSLQSYIKSRFPSKKRTQLNGYIKKLERTFDIKYKMHFGEISKEHYNFLIEHFYKLSKLSFDQKKIKNTKLIPKNFDFIKDVFYELILIKQACIFAVYKDNEPIGISLNYNSDNILFGDSTIYNMDYSKFNVGTIMLMKQLEWCLENDIDKYDFSKGYFPYKKSWCNTTYYFEHHVIYDDSNLKTLVLSNYYINYIKLKQFLREHPFRQYLKKVISR